MSNDETYFEVNDEIRREFLGLSWQLFKKRAYKQEPSSDEIERLEYVESQVFPQGPPMPKEGEVFGYQVLLDVENSIGMEWYDELTKLPLPNFKYSGSFYAYWHTKLENKHLSLWDSRTLKKTLFDKRIIYLTVVKGLDHHSAVSQTIAEFKNIRAIDSHIEEQVCEFCEKRFKPGTFDYSENVEYQLNQKSCSEKCSKVVKWQRLVKQGMHPNAEFDRSITWDLVWQRFGPNCYLCGLETIYDQQDLGLRLGTKAWKQRWGDYRRGDRDRMAVVEHVSPRSKGGSHTWDNLRIACNRCNLLKGDRDLPSLTAPDEDEAI